MKKTYMPGQHVYRILPCPSYDISCMEDWLADMAADGLLLIKGGIFAGIATFEYKEPQKVKYRLEAAQKNTSMWSDDGGEPDPEQVELSEKYAWEYVAKLKDFYIYRSFDPSARELNTDPLNSVKKRQRAAVVSSFLLLVFYPILLTRGCPILTTISTGTWWTTLVLLFVFLMIADEVRAFIHLKRVQKALIDEGCCSPESNGQKKAFTYFIRKAVKTVLASVLVCAFIQNWSASITNENEIPIEEYSGVIPFATIQDFAGEGSSEYSTFALGNNMGFNTIEEKTDWIAPLCIEYNEHAKVKKADGTYIEGGLYVDYFALKNPMLAKLLVKELYRYDKMKKHFDLIDTPELSADYAVAYLDNLHCPTVIIRKDNIVVKAYFYQTSESYSVSIDEWARIVCDSVED